MRQRSGMRVQQTLPGVRAGELALLPEQLRDAGDDGWQAFFARVEQHVQPAG